jgi:4-amino-4-deoxy-L-arabinose transferase-like glycosyltransferase
MGGGATFGGSTGPLRLLNEALGGQAGWFLGFAVAAGVTLAVSTRLRCSDPRTGWLIAVGGAFAVTAITFSRASGIFHPYYVAALAPFTALLVGGGWSLLTRASGPFILLCGAVTEAAVIGTSATDLAWARWPIVGATLVAALGLVIAQSRRARRIVATAGIALLLLAPASWSVQTLGHATSSTFPAGGPASARSMGGGMFGGDTSSLTSALSYVKANGGGTLVVSSQSGAAGSIIASGADVAALGGFSGSETTVSIDWLADMVQQGEIRWIVVSADGATGMRDGRAGSTAALNAAAQVGKAVSSIDGLYDLQGTAAALRALA